MTESKFFNLDDILCGEEYIQSMILIDGYNL